MQCTIYERQTDKTNETMLCYSVKFCTIFKFQIYNLTISNC